MKQTVLVTTDKKTVYLENLLEDDIFMHKQNCLHLATEFSPECLEYLLYGTCAPDIEKYIDNMDFLKSTPLHLAASNTSPACARLIISRIEDVKGRLKITNQNEDTPLHIACRRGENIFIKIIGVLILF